MKLTDTIFKFIETKDNLKSIVFFRIVLGLFCMGKIIVLYSSLVDVYGQYGYLQWAISKAGLFDWLPHMADIAVPLNKIGIDPNQTLFILFYLYLSLLLFLTIGFL